MNSRERVLTTIHHKEPDRVPLFFNSIDAKLMRALGTGTTAEIWKRLGIDTFVIGRTAWCEGRPSGLGYSPNPRLLKSLSEDPSTPVGTESTNMAERGNMAAMWEASWQRRRIFASIRRS